MNRVKSTETIFGVWKARYGGWSCGSGQWRSQSKSLGGNNIFEGQNVWF